ncbi:uncharacterized protein SPPG_01656 [Spizellomyces punctatus DAOM BR117]|uniref:Response regulatory domain-containing protein n=1 Tax=Spizellomyces punctatus (strain DAOM BR117) TaxID=645134 RepID=A0A0L0HTN2_SPIPD|nr:uncharacterized protein SPPG_01656 [Spizellomyces punctatus DAOM BR117]KND04224.1 hypothetical protein SPPG_01656 [Spizellomyces punctatus DAOM BR117]|eukprot:XP_016612263.1 hypothetical protein SPPG_01656 [Spizellomyces punctatus DAOM BR117]
MALSEGLRNLKVAVVDDNEINHKIMCKILYKFLGLNESQVDLFLNGQMCLHALARARYDLILLDIEMPVLDGCQTAIQIRHPRPAILDVNRSIPIIAVTTNAKEHQRQHYLSLGMDAVVGKPIVEPLQFIGLLKCVLAGQKGGE